MGTRLAWTSVTADLENPVRWQAMVRTESIVDMETGVGGAGLVSSSGDGGAGCNQSESERDPNERGGSAVSSSDDDDGDGDGERIGSSISKLLRATPSISRIN